MDTHRRFGSPARPIPHTRVRHGGLGADSNEDIPAGQTESIRELQETLPEGGFTGIRSRSRFFPLLTPGPLGHGGAQAAPDTPYQGPDPAADESQFDDDGSTWGAIPGPIPETVASRIGSGPNAGIEDDTAAMVALGQIAYVRRDVPTSVAALVPVGLPRWSTAGPPPITRRWTRYTLRREFLQAAQRFAGIRFTLRSGARSSTSPVAMLPARSNRLTDRVLPRSFGSTTEVLDDAED